MPILALEILSASRLSPGVKYLGGDTIPRGLTLIATNQAYWCPNCDVPLVQSECEICGSQGFHVTNYGFKPVFRDEGLALAQIFGKEACLPEPLYRSSNIIYFKGLPLFRFTVRGGKLVVVGSHKKVLERILKTCSTDHDFQAHLRKTFAANRLMIKSMNDEAISFIKSTKEEFNQKERFISFSGGKDSTVTAVLVKKALGRVPLLFCNTTIELPETVSYARNFAKWSDLELIEVTPKKEFNELVGELGPPSRVMRWCCFTQKSAPINDFFRRIDQGVLSFDGIRKAESRARTKYARIHENTKITKQTSVYPILDWSDLAVWLFVQENELPLNEAYNWGLSRVGCWACPNEGKLSAFFLEQHHPDLFCKWQDQLEKFAMANGKDISWVRDGEWKKRRAAYEYFEIATKTDLCGKGQDFVYTLKDRVVDDNAINFLKIFGDVEECHPGCENMIRIEGDEIDISAFIGSKEIMAHLTGDNGHDIMRLLEKQIEKGMNCIKCGACVGSCAKGAIKVDDGFHVDKSTCTGCLTCAKGIFLKQSCAAIHYRKERNVIKAVA
jgi:phosphoadenosine phosphosulfate reductase